MAAVESIGISSLVWLDCIFKRMIDAIAGRGGLEAICQFLDQIDFIPGILPLRQSMEQKSIFFETALSKCNKELLKRPAKIRQKEIFDFLGCKCQKCNYTTDMLTAFELRKKCPCGGTLYPLFKVALIESVKQKLGTSPEILLMYEAYERIAQAYVDAYKSLKLVLDETAKLFGWDSFRVEQQELRNYMDQYYFGRLTGETHIPREEKQMLQFLIRGNLAGIPEEDAEKLIHVAMNVVKFGYLFEVLGSTGAFTHYQKYLTEKNTLYNQMNERVRTTTAEQYAEVKHRRIRVSRTLGGYYAPCLLMPRRSWETGQISKDIVLEPVYRLPIFPKSDVGPLQTIYGPKGSGKTFLLSSITCYGVLAKHELVFSSLNDKSNTFTLACMPLFTYNKRTEKLVDVLNRLLGVEPQGIPVLNLTVLRKGEKIDDVEKHPPTIYDRLLEVEDPRGFNVDFNLIMRELKEIAEAFSYSKPVGIISVRNMDRLDTKTNLNIDVQVATNMLVEFDRWRKSHLSQPARVVIDEISYLAASQVVSGDSFRSGAVISDFVKESRRSRLSLEIATQRPLEVIPDIRDAATNVFFRELAMSKDKTRSQIDFLLDSLQLRDPSAKGVVRDINNRGLLGKRYWFWYHQPTRTIEVIKPCPPTFCLQDINMTPREIFKLYEKESGQKILLESWKQVKVLKLKKSTESSMPQFL